MNDDLQQTARAMTVDGKGMQQACYHRAKHKGAAGAGAMEPQGGHRIAALHRSDR